MPFVAVGADTKFAVLGGRVKPDGRHRPGTTAAATADAGLSLAEICVVKRGKKIDRTPNNQISREKKK